MKVRSYDLHELFIFISISNLFISKIIFTYKSRPTILNLSISHRELYTLQEATIISKDNLTYEKIRNTNKYERFMKVIGPGFHEDFYIFIIY